MITRLVFLTILTLLFIQPSVTNAQGMIMDHCASNVGQPVVYFSSIFDVRKDVRLPPPAPLSTFSATTASLLSDSDVCAAPEIS